MKKISIIKVKPDAMGKKSENQLDYNKGIAENSHHWDLEGSVLTSKCLLNQSLDTLVIKRT